MATLSRRDFLKGALATAATAVVTSSVPAAAFADTSAAGAAQEAPAVPVPLNPQDYNIAQCTIEDFATSEFFKPWKFGPLTINGKLIKSAAGSNYLPGVSPEEVADEYGTFARNGIPLVWVEDFVNLYSKYL